MRTDSRIDRANPYRSPNVNHFPVAFCTCEACAILTWYELEHSRSLLADRRANLWATILYSAIVGFAIGVGFASIGLRF